VEIKDEETERQRGGEMGMGRTGDEET